MNRPPSIISFERLYLSSIAVGLVNTAVGWRARQALLDANPAMAANPQIREAMSWVLPAAALIGLAVSLLLWWLVARRGSVVAKWIVVVFAGVGALGAIGTLMTLLRGMSPSVLVSVLSLLTAALSIAAAAMLFRADALPWFGEMPNQPEIVE